MSAAAGEPGGVPAAGYSGTPLPRKLGIKAGARLALIGAPEGFDRRSARCRTASP